MLYTTQNQPIIKVRRPTTWQVAVEASLGLFIIDGIFSLSYGGLSGFWQYLPTTALPFILMVAARLLTLIFILVRDMQLLGLTQNEDSTDLIPITKG
jgi:hypothetical protein